MPAPKATRAASNSSGRMFRARWSTSSSKPRLTTSASAHSPARPAAAALPRSKPSQELTEKRKCGESAVPPHSKSAGLPPGALLLLGVPVGVDRREIRPLFRQILERENRRHRAHRNARAAVNAFHRADVEHRFLFKIRFVFPRVDAVHRANVHTGCILGSDAGLSNYVGHQTSPWFIVPRFSALENPACSKETFLYHFPTLRTSRLQPLSLYSSAARLTTFGSARRKGLQRRNI